MDTPENNTNPVLESQAKEVATDGKPFTLYSVINTTVGKINGLFKTEGILSSGELAQLRRITPDQPYTAALWRVMLMADINQTDTEISQDVWERRWATVLMAMAYNIGLHSYDVAFGEALANAGWSELRFVKLMKSRDELLEIQFRLVARFLAGKNQSANWADAAKLLFYQNGETAEKVRLDISRKYYTALYKIENQKLK